MKENLTEKGALKYRLKAIISNRSATAEQKLKEKLLSVTGVHEKTFSHWLNIPYDDKREIPAGQLRKIAEVLLIPMEELFNETTQAA